MADAVNLDKFRRVPFVQPDLTLTRESANELALLLRRVGGVLGIIPASQIKFIPVGNLSAVDVQGALAELDTEKADAAATTAALATKQPLDATLTALAGLATAADRLAYWSGADVASLTVFTAFARTLLDDIDAAAMRATLGLGTAATAATTDFQPADAELTALASLVSAADRLPYFTGAGAAALATFTAAGRALVDDLDAAAQRTTLGLGTLATQNGTFSGTSSGTNTGDQTITLTGDVGGTGTGSFAATVGANAITYAKMQDVSAASKLLGRGSAAGAGDPQEITLGAGLTMTGATLDTAAGGSGTVTTVSVVSANGFGGSVATPGTTPAITLTTSLTGLLKGNGTAMSVAVAGTDYVSPSSYAAGIATFLGAPSSANLLAAMTDKTGTGLQVFATSPALTTPNIGAATGTSLTVTGALITSGVGIGYTAGAGGTVAQATSKSTGVTLSKLCGLITMSNASLAGDTTVSFVLTNTTIQANDLVIVIHNSVGTMGAYNFAMTPAAGSVTIAVRNITPSSLGEAIVLRFAVIKAVTA